MLKPISIGLIFVENYTCIFLRIRSSGLNKSRFEPRALGHALPKYLNFNLQTLCTYYLAYRQAGL
jgi:hypothetical protein